jgi:hypothetical protein
MTKSKRRRTKPPSGSLPTYIRFTKDQLKAMDDAVNEGRFINRSEAARAAVRQMFGILPSVHGGNGKARV